MIRIKISKKNEEQSQFLTRLYNFPNDNICIRIAFSISLQSSKRFDLSKDSILSADGKDFTNTSNLYGGNPSNSNFIIYRTILDQYYKTNLSDEEFGKLFKLHVDHGLNKWISEIEEKNFSTEFHITYLMKVVKNGIQLISNNTPFSLQHSDIKVIPSYEEVINIILGKDEQGIDISLRINDLKEFDSCNIAIAGMVGSGKTELVKDLLYQISTQSKNKLKFIFFDYKGEGNPDRLKSFFECTGSRMIDLKKAPMDFNPLSFINLEDKRSQEFNIKSFVDTVYTIASGLGIPQRHTLQHVVTECFEQKNSLRSIIPENYQNVHPTLSDVYETLESHYKEKEMKPDTLLGIVSDLANSIFSSQTTDNKIFNESLYINLPIDLSDTLRQLCVFITLRYLLAEFSSSNDTEPTPDRIKPLRYVIVIDEAHVYLKNKNASKALEDILRVLRSKGIVIIMLTQGVEDYKRKEFDFASQIKIPICLNINNKDYKMIESFVGTPRSKQKLQEAILQLESPKAIVNISEPQVIEINQFYKRTLK